MWLRRREELRTLQEASHVDAAVQCGQARRRPKSKHAIHPVATGVRSRKPNSFEVINSTVLLLQTRRSRSCRVIFNGLCTRRLQRAWAVAGLDPSGTAFTDTLIGARPTEIKGVAAAGIGQRAIDFGVLEDNLYTVRANVLAPVPLPAAMRVLISAVGGAVVAGRKRMPG